MKNFKTFLISLTCALTCALLCFGILNTNLACILATAYILICGALFFFVWAILDFIEIFKSKKKIKTNENKKIRVKVIYTDPDLIISDPIKKLIQADDLSTCVQHALCFAKKNHLQIKFMEQLTTED